MDPIAATLKTALAIYTQSLRASGRTTELVKHTRPGDWIVCPSSQVATHVQYVCRGLFGMAHGRQVTVLAPDRSDFLSCKFDSLKQKVKPGERVLFEHTWLEMFYEEQLFLSSRYFKSLSDDLNAKETQQPERPYYVQTPTR